jgi:hypothetical protein
MKMEGFLDKVKKYVVQYVIQAEAEYLGEPGSVKREAVIDKVSALVDIPFIPEFVEGPVMKFLIAYFIDLVVDKLNWATGYSFAGVEIGGEAQTQLAEAADAPLPAVQAAIRSAGPGASVDDKIKALYEQYGIKRRGKEWRSRGRCRSRRPASRPRTRRL